MTTLRIMASVFVLASMVGCKNPKPDYEYHGPLRNGRGEVVQPPSYTASSNANPVIRLNWEPVHE